MVSTATDFRVGGRKEKEKEKEIFAPPKPTAEQAALAQQFGFAPKVAPPPKEEEKKGAGSGAATFETLAGGSNELNQIERNMNKAAAGEAINQQRSVQEVRALQQQDQLRLSQAQQAAQTASPSVNLPEVGGILNPTTIGTNIPSIAGGVTAGAGLGATIGAATTLGLGAPIGAAIGGVIGGITAYLAKLSSDRRQSTKNAKKVFNIASGERYNEIINSANQQSESPADIMYAYEVNLANIQESRRNLRELTKDKVGADLSGAMDELIEVEMYLDREPEYRQQLLIAIANPNPSKIKQIIPQQSEDL